MRVGFLNCHGLSGKADPIKLLAQENSVDIMILTETWLKSNDSTLIWSPWSNLVDHNMEIITGGKRGKNGLLVFGNPKYRAHYREIYVDPHKQFLVCQFANTIIAAAYIPPSAEHTDLTRFLDKTFELTEDAQDLIIVGDLNARMGAFTGDSATNPRGNWFLDKLQEYNLNRVDPIEGKWTTFSATGRGITDLVFTNHMELELRILENQNCGGSDHRPLVIDVPDSNMIEKSFIRWNIRKLADEETRKKFVNELEMKAERIMLEIGELEDVDDIWKVIKDWMEEAATISCGTFRYITNNTNRDFWTQELRDMQELVRRNTITHQTLLNSNQQRPIVAAAYNELIKSNREFREAVSIRRNRVFEDISKNLSLKQNSAALLKILKYRKKRKEGKNCCLNPNLVDDYIGYFNTTFGGEPLGELPGVVEDEDPASTDYVALRFSRTSIEKAISRMSLGKTPGVDGLFIEFYIYGKEFLVPALEVLFHRCNIKRKIPAEWREAMIIPVFKNKNSDKDIANYRPIALTCTARRIFEKTLLYEEMTEGIGKLSDFQGGFRSNRSTLDQALYLQEVLEGNPESIHIFLDLKAAYDLVNRNILWHRLKTDYGVSYSTVERLKMLFDFNISKLVVQGHFSRGLENKRGLLQGSSISPILFNFFIDPLLKELEMPAVPKLKLMGGVLKSNVLAFADDLNIHAGSKEKMETLLEICENWSHRNGMSFAPNKCVVLRNGRHCATNLEFKLYGETLPVETRFEYLGITFQQSGIDWDENIKKRTKKAQTMTNIIAGVGMNGTGFSPEASVRIYKQFIRPIMEYGLQLKVQNQTNEKKMQKVQNSALRSILSANRNTSVAALHRLLKIERIRKRNQILNATYYGRLHNSEDRRIPAVRLYSARATLPTNHARTRRNQINGQREQSLINLVSENPVWPLIKKRPMILHQFGIATGDLPPLSKEEKNRLKLKDLIEMEKSSTNVAGVIPCDDLKINELLTSKADFDPENYRKHRVAIQKWLTGGVANHQTCEKCGNELTRKHSIICSGALITLQQQFPNLLRQRTMEQVQHMDEISYLLHHHHGVIAQSSFKIENCYQAIALIYEQCLGYQVKPNGYWTKPIEAGTREGIG